MSPNVALWRAPWVVAPRQILDIGDPNTILPLWGSTTATGTLARQILVTKEEERYWGTPLLSQDAHQTSGD